MDFFQNGFLSTFPDMLMSISATVVNNAVVFVVIAIVGLEVSRRLTQHGTTLALAMIAAATAYCAGITAFFVW